MLEVVLDKQILVILIGIAAALGVLSKCVAGVSLKRLVRAAGNMNKSNHALVRLIKAKFEHTCMISDRVQNVDAFVGKYLYEYRVTGLRLHTWRRMEKAAVWLCLIFGLAGAAAWYSLYGMEDQVLKYAAGGAGTAILLFLFQLTGDEKYQLEAVKNYMVDYLENICARRFEKAQKKEMREEWKEMAPPEPERATVQSASAPQPAVAVSAAAAPQTVAMTQTHAEPSTAGRAYQTAAGIAGMSEAMTVPTSEGTWDAANNMEPEIAKLNNSQEQKKEQNTAFSQRAKSSSDKNTAAKKKAESLSELKDQTRDQSDKDRDIPKEVLIREILEEFLA